jgi:hypothetical protein
MLPAPTTWTDHDELHRWLAEVDAPDPAPHLLGFAGNRLLVVVRLRPFAPGAHQGPLVEALALALPLGSDRVSVALPGRAWSLDDPVPPVTAGADLRQRVLTQVSVDGHGHDPPALRMRLHPFHTPAGGGLVWQQPVDPGPGEGWIPDALVTLVAARHHVGGGASADDVAQQVDRLDRLGHHVLLPGDRPVRPPP